VTSPRQSAQALDSVQEELRGEYETLGMVGSHGTASGTWFADLTPEDVEQIRALLHKTGAALSVVADELERKTEALERITRMRTHGDAWEGTLYRRTVITTGSLDAAIDVARAALSAASAASEETKT
jgi:hypothetical protein